MDNTFNSNEVLVDTEDKIDLLKNLKVVEEKIVAKSRFMLKCKKLIATTVLGFTAIAVALL